MGNMAWVKERPRSPGLYWYKETIAGQAQCGWFDYYNAASISAYGYWDEPIEFPWETADFMVKDNERAKNQNAPRPGDDGGVCPSGAEGTGHETFYVCHHPVSVVR